MHWNHDYRHARGYRLQANSPHAVCYTETHTNTCMTDIYTNISITDWCSTPGICKFRTDIMRLITVCYQDTGRTDWRPVRRKLVRISARSRLRSRRLVVPVLLHVLRYKKKLLRTVLFRHPSMSRLFIDVHDIPSHIASLPDEFPDRSDTDTAGRAICDEYLWITLPDPYPAWR